MVSPFEKERAKIENFFQVVLKQFHLSNCSIRLRKDFCWDRTESSKPCARKEAYTDKIEEQLSNIPQQKKTTWIWTPVTWPLKLDQK